MRAINLRTEHMANPMGIDIKNPYLSWNCTDGKIQSAITVEGNAEIRPEIAKVCVDADIPLYEMQLKKNSLEDVFKILTSSGEGDSAE